MPNNESTEVMKAYKIAIEAELLGLKTYLDYARATTDAAGKNMFIILATDELEHYRVLTAAMAKEGVKSDFTNIDVHDSLFERMVPRLSDRTTRTKGAAGADQLNALSAALDAERRAVEMYRQMYAKAMDEDARKVFRKLIKVEEAHYEIIQAEIDHITETGYWFGLPEFDMED